MPPQAETVENREGALDRIMRELDAETRELPTEAVRDAQKHREHIIPRLIQTIEDATAKAASGEIPKGNAHFFALYLLTEFEVQEALPAIVEAISLPGELPFDLFGDAITETLAGMLAALAGDTPELLDELIGNRSLNEFVRWEAAQTYLYFVRDSRLTREHAVDRLRCHLRDAIANEEVTIVNALVIELVSYSPHEALDEIREAFRLGLVDITFIDLRDVEQSISDGESRFQEALTGCRPTGIQDAAEELESWYAFGTDKESAITSEVFDELLAVNPLLERKPPDAERTIEESWRPAESIRSSRPRIRRNDPCPCGSGKKFKKCCGSR